MPLPPDEKRLYDKGYATGLRKAAADARTATRTAQKSNRPSFEDVCGHPPSVSSVDSLQEALAYVLACVLNDTTLSSKELAMAARTAASTLIANIKGHFDAQTAALQQQYSEIQQKAASLEDVITVQRHRVEKLSIFTGFLRQHKQTVPTYSPIELTRSESDTDSLFGLLG